MCARRRGGAGGGREEGGGGRGAARGDYFPRGRKGGRERGGRKGKGGGEKEERGGGGEGKGGGEGERRGGGPPQKAAEGGRGPAGGPGALLGWRRDRSWVPLPQLLPHPSAAPLCAGASSPPFRVSLRRGSLNHQPPPFPPRSAAGRRRGSAAAATGTAAGLGTEGREREEEERREVGEAGTICPAAAVQNSPEGGGGECGRICETRSGIIKSREKSEREEVPAAPPPWGRWRA